MTITALKTSSLSAAHKSLFTVKVQPQVVAQVLRAYTQGTHQDTSKTKTRGEVNRTKKKWFKQKGTGNARHGAQTPNIFVGGGVSHGPTGIKSRVRRTTRLLRRSALQQAMSWQAANFLIADELTGANKVMRQQVLTALKPQTRQALLIIATPGSQEIVKALRNVSLLSITTGNRVTAWQISRANQVIVTQAGLDEVAQRLSGKPQSTEVKPAPAVKPAKPAAKPSTKAIVKAAPKTKPTATKKTTAKPKTSRKKVS